MATRFRPLDLNQVQTDSVRRRQWRLAAEQLAAMPQPSAPLQAFFTTLPKLGAAEQLVESARLMARAALAEQPTLWVVDGTAMRAGLAPLLAYLMRRGLVGCMAISGEAAVMDFELAFQGQTDEDPAPGVADGRLGLSRETGEVLTSIINEGVRRGFSIGESLGRGILERQPKYMTNSLLATGAARLTPVSVHVSLGADGFHRFPGADGAMLGKGSLKDSFLLSSFIAQMPEAGLVVTAHGDPALTQVLIHSYALARNMNDSLAGLSLIRLGQTLPDLDALTGVDRRLQVPGPLEINVPLLLGGLFSLVE